MKYLRLFKAVFFQLLLSGYGALAATGRVDLYSSMAYGVLLLLAYFRGEEISRRHKGFGPLAIFGLLASFVLFFLADFMFLSGEFVLSLVHVAMAVSVLKLFTCTSARDYFYLFMIAFGFLLISTTFSIDITFLLFLSWFMIAGILCLMLFEIREASHRFSREEDRDGITQGNEPASPLAPGTPGRINFTGRLLFGLGFLVYLSIVLLTVPIFTILPRLSFGFWQLDLSKRQLISGFSDTTQLGDVTSIMLNQAVVMRVKTSLPPESLPADLKWKGIALDKYDQGGWRLSDRRKQSLVADRTGLVQVGFRRSPERLLYQEFFLEPITSRVLFLAHRPLGVARGGLGLYLTTTGTVSKGLEHTHKIRYSGYSDIYRFSERELLQAPPLAAAAIPPVLLETVPESPRIRALVERVTRGAPGPYQKARLLRDYLRGSYPYALEMRPCPPGRDPVEFFLFDLRRGHCEYFASALAITLRYAGVPSRVVNGFQRGAWNPLNDTLVVRQSDAHSWVEAYFGPEFGWVELDATPAAPPGGGAGWFGFMDNVLESVQFMWIQDVVNYDVGDQVQLFQNLRFKSSDVKDRLRRFFRNLNETIGRWVDAQLDRVKDLQPGQTSILQWVGIGISLALLLVLLGRFRLLPRTWPVRWRRSGRVARASLLYRRFQKRVAAAGLLRRPEETPREFQERLQVALHSERLEEFTRLYYELRFRPGAAGSELLERLEALLAEIEIILRQKKQLIRIMGQSATRGGTKL